MIGEAFFLTLGQEMLVCLAYSLFNYNFIYMDKIDVAVILGSDSDLELGKAAIASLNLWISM